MQWWLPLLSCFAVTRNGPLGTPKSYANYWLRMVQVQEQTMARARARS